MKATMALNCRHFFNEAIRYVRNVYKELTTKNVQLFQALNLKKKSSVISLRPLLKMFPNVTPKDPSESAKVVNDFNVWQIEETKSSDLTKSADEYWLQK